MKYFFILYILVPFVGPCQNIPLIQSFHPQYAKLGDTITIVGSHFNEDLDKNMVFIGSIRAEIISSKQEELQITLPKGAVSDHIEVLTNGLSSISNSKINITFLGHNFLNQKSFTRSNDFRIPYSNGGLKVRDVDQDGKLDITFLAAHNDERAIVGLNKSENNNINIELNRIVAYAGPNSFDFKDLNGDGLPELIHTNEDSENLVIQENRSQSGKLTFFETLTRDTEELSSVSLKVLISDLNKDGLSDIVLNGSQISVFKNSSKLDMLSFAEPVNFSFVGTLVIYDLNGDNLDDFILYNSAGINFYLNKSNQDTIQFESATTLKTDGRIPDNFLIQNLDSDPRPEIMLKYHKETKITILENIAINDGILEIDHISSINVGKIIETLNTHDLNGDGQIDLFGTSVSETTELFIVANQSNENDHFLFTVPTFFLMKTNNKARSTIPQVGDFNYDGLPDIVFYYENAGNSYYLVYENKTTEVKKNYSINENSITSTFVGKLGISNPERDELNYSILSGNELGAFQINQSTGSLSVLDSNPLNFEINPLFELTVVVSDGESSNSGIITIKLNNLNEAPFDIFLSSDTISENSDIGTTIGFLTTEDEDENDSFLYSITVENDFFKIDQDILRSKAIMQFYQTLSHTVEITTLDQAGHSFSKTFEITIIDVNEEILEINDFKIELVELYPNPTKEYLVVKWNNFKNASVVDLSGKKLLESSDRTLDLRKLNKGLYLVTLEGIYNEQLTYRIIKL